MSRIVTITSMKTLMNLENIKGGQGVPFYGLINSGCGPFWPNYTGYWASAAALINAGVFGAPFVWHGLTNPGNCGNP